MGNKDLNNSNIIDELNLLLLNIPENMTDIEKIRWLYIKCGELFSYDYEYITHKNQEISSLNLTNNYISRYQTCINISYILNLMLNHLGIKSKVIARENVHCRGIGEEKHLANEVTLDSGEKYLLDLTLDLYLIQSGCSTKEFGFTDPDGTYDIISTYECSRIDKKLGLLNNGDYLDKELDKFKSYKALKDNDSTIECIYKLNKLIPKFNGYHEGKQFLNKLFFDILKIDYKEFNLKYYLNNSKELYTCFKINEGLWYLYDINLKLIKTNKENILNMLSQGWTTASKTLEEELDIDSNDKQLK